MVKIRLRRMGSKGSPFYRVVVAKSSAGRNGSFVEIIGTYDPVRKPSGISIKEDRAYEWLMSGAQPTETVAYLLKKVGVLDKFFEQRPGARAKFKSLDKRVSVTSSPTVVEASQSTANPAAPASVSPTVPEHPLPAPLQEEAILPAAQVPAQTEGEAEPPAAEPGE